MAGAADIPKQVKKLGPPTDPDKALYEQVRSGNYQINAAIDSIEEARKTAKQMAGREKGDTQHALQTIAGFLDKAGSNLADFADEPPSFEEFKADFKAQDENRLKAIDQATKSLDLLGDAQDVVESLLTSKPPEPEKSQLESSDTALDGCIASLEEAIRAMGGKVSES